MSSACREQENPGQAWYCLNKAIAADPADITLRYHLASLLLEEGNVSKAAETYDQIVQICPDNVEALKTAATVNFVILVFDFLICIVFDT